MKRLYVVYDGSDRPFAECERFRDAYNQAYECLQNNGGYITIDIYFRDWARGYTYECANGDFYFMDRRWEAMSSSDLADAGIMRYTLTSEITTLQELEILKRISQLFEFELNDISKDLYQKFYWLKRKKNG